MTCVKWLAFAATLLVLPAGACLAQNQLPKVLRVAPMADLTLLDPTFSSIAVTRTYGLMVYDTLFSWDSKLEPKPQMVKEWSTSPDNLTWRFTLRPGLKFHDGQKVTTADIIPSLRRWMKRDGVGQQLETAIESMTAIDADTFEIKLSKPYPALLFSLGSGTGLVPVIMRAKDLEGDPSKPITTAIGSGPFRFNQAERVSGALTVFDRNPDYVPRDEPPDGLAGGHRVKVDRVEWKVIPDPSTAAAALQAGEIDLWEQPLAELLALFKRNRNVRVEKRTDLGTQVMLRPNSLYPPFNDPRARLALALIVNQEDIMTAGFAEPENWAACRSFFVCGSPSGTLAGTEALKPDLARAKALLAEAGYKGEKLILPSTREIGWIGPVTDVVADELKQAGLNVDVVWSDWGTTAARQTNRAAPGQGGWNLAVTSLAGPTMASPLTNVGTIMTCNGTNFAGWPCDKEAEGLRATYLYADDAARPAALDRLHRYLLQVQPYVVLGQYNQSVAIRSNVSGFLPAAVMTYWNMEKK